VPLELLSRSIVLDREAIPQPASHAHGAGWIWQAAPARTVPHMLRVGGHGELAQGARKRPRDILVEAHPSLHQADVGRV
ncbi:hypothetical protein GGH91_004500, partial [Coemansia sp. RSA 2671]